MFLNTTLYVVLFGSKCVFLAMIVPEKHSGILPRGLMGMLKQKQIGKKQTKHTFLKVLRKSSFGLHPTFLFDICDVSHSAIENRSETDAGSSVFFMILARARFKHFRAEHVSEHVLNGLVNVGKK